MHTTTTAPSTPVPTVCLGLDIAKLKLDACLRIGSQTHHHSFANSLAGLKALRAWCQRLGQPTPRTVLEATGCYSELATTTLQAAGFPVHLANPRRIKDYARSLGRRNKTDRVDADLIAAFGLSRALPLWQPPAPALHVLRALLRRLADLQVFEQAERNRQEAAGSSGLVAKSLTRFQRALAREIRQLETQLAAHLKAHVELQADVERLCQIAGIGLRSACWLCAELPRHLPNPRAAAAWLGVTPRVRQSGTSLRFTAPVGTEGNRHLRKVLFMAAMAARRFNPRFRTFADRLAANGKAKLSVVIAVLHKLLKVSFALLKNQSSFDPLHHPIAFSKNKDGI
jgi:transposase